MKKRYYYLIILIMMFTLVVFTKGFNMFGSLTDWYNQHIIMLDILKRCFLSSNNYLVPYIGGITNIFSISYYGLFNPLYIPYFFINIPSYIYMSFLNIFMYLLLGISTFAYLNTKYDERKSLLGTVIVITASPVLFHYHRQVMFVNYLPFLLLGLYSIDKEKKFLLSLSIILIALTSFFYLIPSIVVLLIYYMYRKSSEKIIERGFVPIALGLLSSSFLLMPTFMNLVINRLFSVSKSILILLPNVTLNSILYDPYSLGISILTLFIIYMGLFNKNKRIKFLSLSLLVIFLFGIFSYFMNGTLYARSKILIPFIYLVVILVLDNIDSIKKFDYKYIGLFFIVLIISFISVYMKTKYIYLFLLEVILLIVYLVKKDNNILKYSLILTCLVSCFITNYKADYPAYERPFDKDINNLLDETSALDRVSILVDKDNNYNGFYNINTSSIYSSSVNKYYYAFIRGYLDLDQYGENYLMINPSSNILNNTYMSNKYIIDYKDKNYLGYKEVNTSGTLSLYKNDNVLPIVYSSNKNNILFNLDNLEEYNISSLNKEYEFTLEEDKEYTINLDNELKNKVLVIKFDINPNNEERIISINDVINKISSNKWVYYNKNDEFTYYISETSIKELNIYVSKGNYKISDIRTYTIDYDNVLDMVNSVDKIEDLSIEKDSIKGTINAKENGYLITNIPYDKDFDIYIDNNKVNKEKVNDYFIGSSISKGSHNIKIKYQNNTFYIGVVISLLSLLFIAFYERKS